MFKTLNLSDATFFACYGYASVKLCFSAPKDSKNTPKSDLAQNTQRHKLNWFKILNINKFLI
jgi:hypothetical protein